MIWAGRLGQSPNEHSPPFLRALEVFRASAEGAGKEVSSVDAERRRTLMSYALACGIRRAKRSLRDALDRYDPEGLARHMRVVDGLRQMRRELREVWGSP